MKAQDLMKAAHIAAETTAEGCVKITTEKGWRLRHTETAESVNADGETETRESVFYATELFCAADAELPDYEVVEDTAHLNEELSGLPLAEAKAALVAKITEYDTSEAVNSFTVLGQSHWLDRTTRVSLMNSATVSKGMGAQSVILWLDGTPIELPTEVAIMLLSQVEMYAQECFNVTCRHKVAVAALETVEECVGYDYTAGYPARLEFDLTNF